MVQQAPVGAALAVMMRMATGLQLMMPQQHHQDSKVTTQPQAYLSYKSRTQAAGQLLRLLAASRTSSTPGSPLVPTPAVLPSAQAYHP
jgi:hypothetical protein